MLKVGELAPSFEKVDHRGQLLVLDSLVTTGPVVLYFYPRDMTLGCTIEACSFRDAHTELSGLPCTVIGASFDSLESHREFAAKHNLPFSLISDEDKQLATQYDVLGFFALFPRRVTFVIGAERRLLGVFHHELSMRAHVRNVRGLLGHSSTR